MVVVVVVVVVIGASNEVVVAVVKITGRDDVTIGFIWLIIEEEDKDGKEEDDLDTMDSRCSLVCMV